MYGSWDMKFNRQNFFVILGNCLLFYHPLFYQIAAAAHRQCAGYASAVRGSVGNKFSSYGDLKFKKFHFVVHLGSTSWRSLFKQTVNKLNLWWRTTVDKSAWIEAWLYFSIWLHFQPKKWKFQKQWKRGLEISFYTSVPKIMIICYTVPEISHMSGVIVIFHFGQFLSLFYPPNSHKNENFTQMKKSTWRYQHLPQVYQKSWSYAL